MTITEAPWTAPAPAAAGLQLVMLNEPLMAALAEGDLAAAQAHADFALTPYLTEPDCVRLWRLRRDQVARHPGDRRWVTRIVADMRLGVAVGRAGFHGPPDDGGMVEFGYATDPAYQRRGYARGALEILLYQARRDPGAAIVRATISPRNDPSLALVKQYGFTLKGEQWDDEDGLELIFEIPAV